MSSQRMIRRLADKVRATAKRLDEDIERARVASAAPALA